jgi:uncharacterized protein YggU (UPF0235/DUF167 family)
LAGVEPVPVRRLADGISVAVRLTPKAGTDRIDGIAADAAGGCVLKARVTAVPETGKANAAFLKLLAKQWKLPKSSFSITGGAKDRNKVVHVAGDPETLYLRLAGWFKERHD